MQTAVTIQSCAFGYTVNGGAAESKGLDLGADAALSDRLTVHLTAAYTDAHHIKTLKLDDRIIVGKGDAIGSLPLVTPPLSVTV